MLYSGVDSHKEQPRFMFQTPPLTLNIDPSL